jgi:Ni/Co efflux regulator RcnB
MNRTILILVALALIASTSAVSSQDKEKDKVFRSVANDTVEKVLQSLEVKYHKEERKEKDTSVMFFEFKRGDQAYRLFNYVNDLWIESTFEKSMKAEDINRWNADAKFSRLVQVQQRDKTILSLECQIDCLGGITEAGIKQFVNRFDEEAKRFSKFK